MEAVEKTYLYTSVVSNDCNEDEFLVEFFLNEAAEVTKPAAVIKNFDDLLEFLEQYDED